MTVNDSLAAMLAYNAEVLETYAAGQVVELEGDRLETEQEREGAMPWATTSEETEPEAVAERLGGELTGSVYDWLDNALDVEVTFSLQGSYLGATIYVTAGGPTIWLDTREGAFCGKWGLEEAQYGVDSDAVAEVDAAIEELVHLG